MAGGRRASGAPGVSDYLPIAGYGVIGDLHTAALVGRQGSIDWWCPPRYDAPSVFGAILDARRGGRWSVAPETPFTSEQRYLPGTNILETNFHLDQGGLLSVADFMPLGAEREGKSAIFRRIRGVRSLVPVAVRLEPRFSYGREPARFQVRHAGLLATSTNREVLAFSASPGIVWQIEDGAAVARFGLRPEDTVWLVLRHDEDEVLSIDALRPQAIMDDTAHSWDNWLTKLRYQGPYRQEVERSALALKLLQYNPTGAMVAAPTTSLPEWPGGVRNWDYRYTWVRDSSYLLFALNALGFESEAESYLSFLKRLCRQSDARHLQILHQIDGYHQLAEQELTHLEGYGGARPVRIGNGAYDQFQLDIYGELLDTLFQGHRYRVPSEGLWVAIRGLVDWVAANWRLPDFGIWEARREPRHHVFSKIMAWCALDRGIRLALRNRLPGEVDLWRRAAAALRAEVLDRGWSTLKQSFVQAYGDDDLDAALLVIPLIGFLPRSDPRVCSTLNAIRQELSAGPEELIYRYRSPDGLAGEEGAFLVCSFWMVQNLALVGQRDEAARLYRLLLRRGGPLGLFPEEIDPRTGDFLGNYPLGLSHAALLNCAVTLQRVRAADVPVNQSPVPEVRTGVSKA
jgi:GH15 family glucan-1,4-alpha-glucosidase